MKRNANNETKIKSAILGLFLVLLFSGAAVADSTSGQGSGSSQMTSNVIFSAPAGGSTTATGQGSISVSQNNGLDMVWVGLNFSGLQMQTGKVFEAWLSNTGTSNMQSIGAFVTDSSGAGRLTFREPMVNFGIYNQIVITAEPVHDIDPAPSAQVLMGSITPSVPGTVNMKANLNGSQEVPVVSTTATGYGTFVINTADNTLKYMINYQGLSSNETAASIDGFAPSGQNAVSLFTLPSGSTKTGLLTYSSGQEAQLLSGQAYVNISTVNNPNGELRGQIVMSNSGSNSGNSNKNGTENEYSGYMMNTGNGNSGNSNVNENGGSYMMAPKGVTENGVTPLLNIPVTTWNQNLGSGYENGVRPLMNTPEPVEGQSTGHGSENGVTPLLNVPEPVENQNNGSMMGGYAAAGQSGGGGY